VVAGRPQRTPDAISGSPQPVQVFGRKDSRETQKALRFFKERRVPVNFVDLAVKPMAPTELRRFSARHGARALLDEKARAYQDAGLAYLRLEDDEIFERLLANQRLIRLPLVRAANNVAVGPDDNAWWLLRAGPCGAPRPAS
jgi:arsenate reductase-like glutaredoxin family protein